MELIRCSSILLMVIVAIGHAATATGADAVTYRPGPASEATRLQNALVRRDLPFADRRDFQEADRGFIAGPDANADYGRLVSRAFAEFDFLEQAGVDSIHPSLVRQAQLNARAGLFEVVAGKIYQVRGFGLANMTLVSGRTGWIVFDTLLTTQSARAALDLVDKELGQRPIVAVVYSHSHVDHFGGVRGIVDEEEVRAGRVQIIAPKGFMEHVVAENIYAGNAMARRITYQYGTDLAVGAHGYVDSGIGKAGERGTISLIAPTDVIEAPFAEREIDGVKVIFQNTPETEAPAEMNAYLPELRTFWAAENVTGTIHNVYTLRGALVRDALAWSRYINVALYRFGREAEIMIASHNWPRWGNDRVQEVMRAQRDVYANLNNQSLHLANQGVTVNQIQNEYQVPKSLAEQWAARQYHGSELHNSRAVINRFLGYWDGNPATLVPLSPEESAPLYVAMMGGAAPILERSQKFIAEGRYRHAVELLNKLVYAEPTDQAAKNLLATAFEQLGYQYESGSLRHAHLAAARELRVGITGKPTLNSTSPDLLRAISTQQWWESVAIRVDSALADGMRWVINMETPDNGERFVVEMSGATLTCIEGYSADTPDASITVNRSDLEKVISGQSTLLLEIDAGRAQLAGDRSVLSDLESTLVRFDPNFEIMPGTSSD